MRPGAYFKFNAEPPRLMPDRGILRLGRANPYVHMQAEARGPTEGYLRADWHEVEFEAKRLLGEKIVNDRESFAILVGHPSTGHVTIEVVWPCFLYEHKVRLLHGRLCALLARGLVVHVRATALRSDHLGMWSGAERSNELTSCA